MDVAGSTQQNDVCTHEFQPPINAKMDWMERRGAKERERGWRSEGETERKSTMASREERKIQIVPFSCLIVFIMSSVFTGLCLCVVQSRVLCVCPTLRCYSRASVFVTSVFWWREWLVFISWWDEMTFISNLRMFARWSSKAFRSDARDAEKTAEVLVVYPVHCSISQWRDTWLQHLDVCVSEREVNTKTACGREAIQEIASLTVKNAEENKIKNRLVYKTAWDLALQRIWFPNVFRQKSTLSKLKRMWWKKKEGKLHTIKKLCEYFIV